MVDFETRTAQLDDLLGVGRNFDMVSRSLQVGGRKARLWVVNGYAEDMLIERMIGAAAGHRRFEEGAGSGSRFWRLTSRCRTRRRRRTYTAWWWVSLRERRCW